MTDTTQLSQLASLVLPPSIMDFFDITGMDVEVVAPKPGDHYTQIVHIYLDEKTTAQTSSMDYVPMGLPNRQQSRISQSVTVRLSFMSGVADGLTRRGTT